MIHTDPKGDHNENNTSEKQKIWFILDCSPQHQQSWHWLKNFPYFSEALRSVVHIYMFTAETRQFFLDAREHLGIILPHPLMEGLEKSGSEPVNPTPHEE